MAVLSSELTLKDINFSTGIKKACAEAKTSLGNLNTGLKGFGDVLGGVSPQISNTINSLTSLSTSVTKLINPYTAAAAAVVGLGAAWFEYNKTLDEQRDLTQQFLGVTGSDLEKIRDNIAGVANAFGKDYRDVLTDCDTIMSQFGTTAGTALDAIQTALAAGADDTGQFQAQLQKFGPLFHDAGLGAEELVSAIVQTRSGIFTEDGMNAIAVGTRKIKEMGKSTADALAGIGLNGQKMVEEINNGTISSAEAVKQVSEKMKEFGADTSEAAAVMKDVFGKAGVQAGKELIDTLSEMDLSLDSVKDNLTENQRAQLELSEASREFEGVLSSMFGVSENGFSTMWTQIKTKVMKACVELVRKFVDLYNKSTILRGAVASFALQWKQAWTIIKTACRYIGTGIYDVLSIMEDLLSLDFAAAGADVNKLISDMGQIITEGANELVGNVKDAFDQTFNGHLDLDLNLDMDDALGDLESGTEKAVSNGVKKGTAKAGKGGKGGKGTVKVDLTPYEKAQKTLAEAFAQMTKIQNNLDIAFANGVIKASDVEKGKMEAVKTYVKVLQDNASNLNETQMRDLKAYTVVLLGYADKLKLAAERQKMLSEALKEAKNIISDYNNFNFEGTQIDFSKLLSKNNQVTVKVKPEFDSDLNLPDIEANIKPVLSDDEVLVHFKGDESGIDRIIRKYNNQQIQFNANVAGISELLDIAKNLKIDVPFDTEAIKATAIDTRDAINEVFTGITVIPEVYDNSQEAQLQRFKDAITAANEAIMQNNETIAKLKQEISKAQDQLQILNGEFANMSTDDEQYEQTKTAIEEVTTALDGYIQKLGVLMSVNGQLDATNAQLLTGYQSVQTALTDLQKAQEVTSGIGNSLNALGQAFNAIGDATENKAINVAGMIAQAIAQVTLGFAQAMASPATSAAGIFGWIAGSISGLATLASLVYSLKSMNSYASGGIISGFSSVGDKNIARVNSGEMLLTETQQARLFKLANGAQQPQGGNQTGGNVRFEISGQKLVGVLNNYNTRRKQII